MCPTLTSWGNEEVQLFLFYFLTWRQSFRFSPSNQSLGLAQEKEISVCVPEAEPSEHLSTRSWW